MPSITGECCISTKLLNYKHKVFSGFDCDLNVPVLATEVHVVSHKTSQSLRMEYQGCAADTDGKVRVRYYTGGGYTLQVFN